MTRDRSVRSTDRAARAVWPALLLALAVLAAAQPLSAATPVDGFQAPADGAVTLQATKDRPASSTVQAPGALYGARAFAVSVLAGDGTATADARDGRFTFASEAATQGEAVLTWGQARGARRFDLTAGAAAVRVPVLSATDGAELQLEATDGTHASTYRVRLSAIASQTLLDVPFASFVASGPPTNFASLQSLRLRVRGTAANVVLGPVATAAAATGPGGNVVTANGPKKTDALAPGGDADADTRVDPGDTLRYTITIPSGGTLSQAVVLTDTIDPQTTLVPGSVHVFPLAFDDGPYNAVGNTLLFVGPGAQPAAPVAVASTTSLLANDKDFNGTTALTAPPSASTTITGFTATSANGGTVSVAANGSFTYLPAVGFAGADTFTYTITDTRGGSDTATVRITVANKVWYVDSAAAASGDGRSTAPFDALGDVTGATGPDVAGDIIYVRQRGTYAGGIGLLNNQLLVGGGSALVVGGYTLIGAGTNTTITNAAGNGVSLAASNTVTGFTITGTTGAKLAGADVGGLTVSTVTLQAGGAALDLTSAGTAGNVSVTIDALTSTSSVNAIKLTNLRGTLTVNNAGGAGAISGATGADVLISGGTANVSIATPITNTAGRSVDVQNLTGGTIGFSGAISDTGTGIFLNANGGGTGGTINFTGGLSLSTGTNAAFTATGGGTVTATQNNTSIINTATTTTGTTLNAANTTIGASGLTFRSISSGSGAPSGIILNGTGAGPFTVTGNSSGLCGGNVTGGGSIVTSPVVGDCTGGVIQGASGAGIQLTNTGSVSLTRMRVTGGGDDGIRGSGVTGFTLTAVLIENNGNAVGERGIDMLNLSGSGGISASTVSGSAEHNVIINNTTSSLSSFNVTNSFIGNTSMVTGDDGIQLLIDGAATITASVTQSAFTDNKGDHFQAASTASTTGSINATFNNNTLKTTAANDPNVVGGGITINPGNSADITFTISGNNIQQAFDDAININHDPGSTSQSALNGTISGNTIGTAGDPGSGSESSNAITLGLKGAGTNSISVTNNVIREWSNAYCIFVGITEGTASASTTVTGNNCRNPGAFAINGIHINAGATAGDNGTLCVVLTGNDVTGSGVVATGDADIRLRQRFTTTIRLPGYAGANTDTAAVNAFVAANNDPAGATPAPTVSSVQNVGGGGGGFVGGGTCP